MGSLERAVQLIDALMDPKLDPKIQHKIQEWFRSSVSEAQKQEAFVLYAQKIEPCRGALQGAALRRYNELAEALGLRKIQGKGAVSGRYALRNKRLPLRVMLQVVAVAVPLLMALWLFRFSSNGDATLAKPMQITISSQGTGHDEVVLPDGSRVRLAKDTKLVYVGNFTENRSVQLDGEAYFVVAEDPEHPFIVQTDHVKVKVLGTEFNMNAYSEDPKRVVSLVRGRVEVSYGAETVTLEPMDELRYDVVSGIGEKERVKEITIDRWKSGRMELWDRTLSEALRDVAGFYAKELVFVDAIAVRQTVTTILKEEESLETVLYVIQHMTGDCFGFEVDRDTIYITKR